MLDTAGTGPRWAVVLAGVLLLMAGMWLAAGLPVLGAVTDHVQIYQLIWAIVLSSAVSVAAWWWAAAGYGWLLWKLLIKQHGLTHDAADVPTMAVCGMAMLMLLLYVGALVVGYALWFLLVLLVIGVAITLIPLSRWFRTTNMDAANGRWPWTIVLVMLATAPSLVATTCPPAMLWPTEAFGYDVLTYHLVIPREWLAAGAMVPLEHNVYAYLPGLMETMYGWQAMIAGGIPNSVYAAALLHYSTALAAALVLAGMIARFARWTTGLAAAAVLLATPWVMITATQAYNETAMLMFAAAGWSIAWRRGLPRTTRGAATIGVMLGMATLSKLTAAFMLGVPVFLAWFVMTWRACALHQRSRTQQSRMPWRATTMLSAVVIAAGLLTLSPYLMRNAVWTGGNPVFPFATSIFGDAHWYPQNVERWRLATNPTWAGMNSFQAAWIHGLANRGYGAVGGWPTGDTGMEVARFEREGGVGLLWLAAGLGGIVLLVMRRGRLRLMAGLAMGVWVLQWLFWLTLTHMQSRFLMPMLLPMVLLIGLAAAGRRGAGHVCAPCHVRVHFRRYFRGRGFRGRGFRGRGWCTGAIVVLAVVMTWQSMLVLSESTNRMMFEPGPEPPPVWACVGTLEALQQPSQQTPGSEPMKMLLVPGSEPVLYMQGEVDHATPFDVHPLGEAVRQVGDNPAALTRELYDRGYRSVQFNLPELARLQASYNWPWTQPAHKLLQAWLGANTQLRLHRVVFRLRKENGQIMVERVQPP